MYNEQTNAHLIDSLLCHTITYSKRMHGTKVKIMEEYVLKTSCEHEDDLK
jgi:hypothetical protein